MFSKQGFFTPQPASQPVLPGSTPTTQTLTFEPSEYLNLHEKIAEFSAKAGAAKSVAEAYHFLQLKQVHQLDLGLCVSTLRPDASLAMWMKEHFKTDIECLISIDTKYSVLHLIRGPIQPDARITKDEYLSIIPAPDFRSGSIWILSREKRKDLFTALYQRYGKSPAVEAPPASAPLPLSTTVHNAINNWQKPSDEPPMTYPKLSINDDDASFVERDEKSPFNRPAPFNIREYLISEQKIEECDVKIQDATTADVRQFHQGAKSTYQNDIQSYKFTDDQRVMELMRTRFTSMFKCQISGDKKYLILYLGCLTAEPGSTDDINNLSLIPDVDVNHKRGPIIILSMGQRDLLIRNLNTPTHDDVSSLPRPH